MIKKLTGTVFTPQEFKELNRCVYCGKAEKIKYGGKCSECWAIDYKNCEMCEIVLRDGFYKFYSYDNREDKRETEIEFKANKHKIREFVAYEERHNMLTDSMCKSCVGWEKRMKDICWKCDNDFYNNKENYKLNGNMCEECALLFN